VRAPLAAPTELMSLSSLHCDYLSYSTIDGASNWKRRQQWKHYQSKANVLETIIQCASPEEKHSQALRTIPRTLSGLLYIKILNIAQSSPGLEVTCDTAAAATVHRGKVTRHNRPPGALI
jgi:hypothetical protein